MWNENTKKPIWVFLALTFLISWVSEGVLFLVEQTGIISGMAGFIFVIMFRGITSGSAPAWALFILLKKHGQIRGFKDFFLRIFKTENVKKTIVITTAFFLLYFISLMLSSQYQGDTWYFALIAVPWLVAGIIGGGMEEPGWRGFFQPALEERFPFIVSTLFVGVIWAVWHIPSFFTVNSGLNILSFTLFCIGLSFVMATLYKLTKCVFTCVLFHSWSNAMGNVFLLDFIINPPNIKLIVICAVQICVSITINAFVDYKKNNNSSQHEK